MDTIIAILLAHPEANMVGAVCVLLGATWPLYKGRTAILLAQAALHVGFSLHFFLLGAMSGSLMNALGLGQIMAAIPLGKNPGFKKLYIAYLPIIAIAAVYTWQGPASLFAALGLTLFSLARYQSGTFLLRVFMVAAILSWTVHDYLVLSIPALTTDVLSLATSFFMIHREHRVAKAQALLEAKAPA